MEPRIVTAGLKFPEGPVWLQDGTLLVGEIVSHELTRVRPDGSKECVANCGGGVNGVAIGPGGDAYVCNAGHTDAVHVASRDWYFPGDEPQGGPDVGSSRVDLQACKLEYSIVSPK